MEINEQLREAHSILRLYLTFANTTVLLSQILATAVFPVVEVILGQQQNVPSQVWWIIGFFHLIFAVHATYGFYRLSEFAKLIRLDDLEQELHSGKTRIDEFTKNLDGVISQSASIQGALSVLQGLLPGTNSQILPPTDEDIEKLMAPLIKARAKALEFTSQEMYNFAIYLFDPQKEQLEVFFRSCDDRIQIHNRPWRIGVGHVGLAFAQNRTIIVDNISDIHDELVGKPTFLTDKDFYTSFIATPIPDGNENAREPIGVLVITSSRPSHFGQEHKILAESFALILSTYFCSHTKWEGHHG